MTLSNDERAILRRVADSPEPVAMSDYFHDIHPPVPGMTEDSPEQEAWTMKQIDLFGAGIDLWEKGLVTVVHPANGERPDLVEATPEGRTALASEGEA